LLDIHIQIHYHFSTFFLVLASGTPTVIIGHTSVKLPPAQTSSYATA